MKKKKRKFVFEVDEKENSISISKFPDDINVNDLYMIASRIVSLAVDPECGLYTHNGFDLFSKQLMEDLMVASVEANTRREDDNSNRK